MRRHSGLATGCMILLTSLSVTGAPAGAAGPFDAGTIGGPAIASPGRHAVQDRIVPHGFFSLPAPNQDALTGGIVPHGSFALPAANERRPHHRGNARRPIVTGAFAPPLIVTPAPAEAYVPEDYPDTTGYYDAPDSSRAAYGYSPPMVYTQPVTAPIPAAPSPPPTPSVIQYENGRYELRGDGMTTPYTWVWIPNPPPPPPPPPPAAPPAPRLADNPPPRSSQLYRWTDEQGVVHLTDRLDSVPRAYRAQAKETPGS
jgi:hypothetical protein